MTRRDANWFTHVRVERLLPALRAIQMQPPPGVAHWRATRTVWNQCGGPFDEVADIIDVLADIALIAERGGYLRTTKHGRAIATQDHHTGGRGMVRALLRAGLFADQVRRLLEVGERTPDGSFTCRRSVAIENAPQLLGALRRWPNVTVARDVYVPAEVAKELADPWSLIRRDGYNRDIKKVIGERAELYTYLQERRLADDPSSIRWVSRDDDDLGFDVEDLSTSPSRRIEVKGTSGALTRFYMSTHEWAVAHEEPQRYEVQFWGRIDLERQERSEFQQLRKLGYPIVFSNLETAIRDGRLCVRTEIFRLESKRSTP
jgi:hypothetical protein